MIEESPDDHSPTAATEPPFVHVAPSDTPESTEPPDIGQVSLDECEKRSVGLARGVRERKHQAVVSQNVLDAIHGHGKSSTTIEVCGVLVGQLCRDEFGPFLHIRYCIRGDRAKGHSAQVTFTAETWSAIQATMDSEFPEEKIVGWYHTHPGFGIFLSGMDLFIQDHFFNLPWQVAFVYDPISGEEGMFYWKEGKADRHPYLIEAPPLASHGGRHQPDIAPTLAEMEAAELATLTRQSVAQNARRAGEGALPRPIFIEPLPPPTPPTDSQTNTADVQWSGTRAVVPPRRVIVPMWFLGALAFAISFGGTMWAMFEWKNQNVIILPPHRDAPLNKPVATRPMNLQSTTPKKSPALKH